jgi:hypothetical protein
MHVEHPHSEPASLDSRLGHSVGDIVKLQIQENFTVMILNHAHHIGTAAGEKLLADLEDPDFSTQTTYPFFRRNP